MRQAPDTIPSGGVASTRGVAKSRVELAPFNLESTYGSVKPANKPDDFERISKQEKEAKAENTLREMSVHY